MPLARAIGQLRSPRQILSSWPQGDALLGPKVVLFMHFDRNGAVRQQLFDYMRELAANGRSIVFVSNARRLQPEAAAALRQTCAAVLVRRNIGYDFGAWRDALDHLGLPRSDTEEIILANDSVFGPLLPLGDMLRRLNYDMADVWGLTESWQLRYHLQSFFLAFGPTALRSASFAQFWRSVRPVPLKFYIVYAFEVGVTQALVKGGLRCAALWSYENLIGLVNRDELERVLTAEANEIDKADPIQQTRMKQVLRIRDGIARRVALNPTADLWRQLLMSGFPFIKRELLRDNPTKVEDVGDWKEVVREALAADPDPILLDLRTMLKGSAP
ncbi:MAG: lipopolysaccharide biosynthesis protein [Rhodospirillales bacterium 20-64-7]|nr:MAG: lipopolysaccharide biosynthesis protein [Rhodospirillales bacterium 20-64-7]